MFSAARSQLSMKSLHIEPHTFWDPHCAHTHQKNTRPDGSNRAFPTDRTVPIVPSLPTRRFQMWTHYRHGGSAGFTPLHPNPN